MTCVENQDNQFGYLPATMGECCNSSLVFRDSQGMPSNLRWFRSTPPPARRVSLINAPNSSEVSAQTGQCQMRQTDFQQPIASSQRSYFSSPHLFDSDLCWSELLYYVRLESQANDFGKRPHGRVHGRVQHVLSHGKKQRYGTLDTPIYDVKVNNKIQNCTIWVLPSFIGEVRNMPD